MTTIAERMTMISNPAPSAPRLRLAPTLSSRTVLDGGTGAATAQAAMALAAQAANTFHAPDILTAVTDRQALETTWESEGGHLQSGGV